MTERSVQVVRAGMLTTVQDLGRFGHRHLGVPRSGALDAPAHRLANRLVGNSARAASLETTVNGLTLRARCPVTAAVTGAPCAVRIDGRPAAWGAPIMVPAGAVLELGPATHGVRSYLALAGGIEVAAVLGSRSTDLLSGLGPAPLTEGDVLPLGAAGRPAAYLDAAPCPAPPAELVLPLIPGPRHDWFTAEALGILTTAGYTIAAASNRVGLRMDGPPLPRARDGELPSEGMILGAVEVPPDGRPLIFLADHPTTGGYPVIGVVPEEALPPAAQARPGAPVRFILGRASG